MKFRFESIHFLALLIIGLLITMSAREERSMERHRLSAVDTDTTPAYQDLSEAKTLP